MVMDPLPILPRYVGEGALNSLPRLAGEGGEGVLPHQPHAVRPA